VHIVIDAQPDPALWRSAFRDVLRGPMRRIRVMGGFLAALGLLLFAVSIGDHDDAWPAGLAVIAVGLIFALLLPARSVQGSLRRLPVALQQPQRIELTDRTVKLVSPLMSTEYAWAAFAQIREIPGVLMLMVGKYQVLPVPIGGLSPQELAQLREFVANQAFIRR
jgi:hypothetical protein